MSAEFERILMTHLQKGQAEPFVLRPGAEIELRSVLSRVARSEHAVEDIHDVQVLADGLHEMGALTVATLLYRILRTTPATRAILSPPRETVVPQPAYADPSKPCRWAAPMFGAASSTGFRVADFLDPSSTGRIRSASRTPVDASRLARPTKTRCLTGVD